MRVSASSFLKRRVMGLSLLIGLCLPGVSHAQTVTLEAPQTTLPEITEQLARQTGYEFRLLVDREAREVKRSFSWKDARLGKVIGDLAAAFECDIFSVDASGFFIGPRDRAIAREARAGSLLVQARPLTPSQEHGVVQLTLVVGAPDDEQMEAIAGFGSDLRIVDNFGRTLIAPTRVPIRSTSAPRMRLTEYQQQFSLGTVDERALRVRYVRGSLVLYRKLTPIRLEFSLEKVGSQSQSQAGVEVRLEQFEGKLRDYVARTRLAWPSSQGAEQVLHPDRGLNVVGRGISRTPSPYLVDETGRIYRDASPRTNRLHSEGEDVIDQQCRFEGLEGRPVKLVYELLVREDPGELVPFRLEDLPLPVPPGRKDERKRLPLYAPDGGTLALAFADAQGGPLEGEAYIGLSRKEAGGWGGWRWFSVITDAKGRSEIPSLVPGEYRVMWQFRLDPARPPVGASRQPLTATVAARKEALLPPQKVPVTLPAEP